MRSNLFIRLISLLLLPTMLLQSAGVTTRTLGSQGFDCAHPDALSGSTSSPSRAESRDAVEGQRFDYAHRVALSAIEGQALAMRTLSSISGVHLAFSRVLGLRTAAAWMALSSFLPFATFRPWKESFSPRLRSYRERILKPLRRLPLWKLSRSEILQIVAFLSLFVGAAVFAYLHWHGDILSDPLAERKSYALLTGAGGLAGGLIAQWFRIRSGKQVGWKVWPLVLLIALNVGYSTFGEKPIYGDWLESIPGFWHIPAPLVQWIIDIFGISLVYTDPAAFLVYGTYLDPRREHHARQEISEKFLGFYVKYGWVWGIFLAAALAMKNSPIISFAFLQMGILIWNVAFEYEKFPTSQQVLDWAGSHRGFQWLAPILRRIVQLHAHPVYFSLLRWTIVFIWLTDVSHFLSQIGWPNQWIAYFAGFVLMAHISVLGSSTRRYLLRLLAWLTPLISAPLLAAIPLNGAPQTASGPGWGALWLLPLMIGGLAHKLRNQMPLSHLKAAA